MSMGQAPCGFSYTLSTYIVQAWPKPHRELCLLRSKEEKRKEREEKEENEGGGKRKGGG